MLVEQRTYQLKTGAAGRYFENFGSEGMRLQTDNVQACLGHYVTEIGPHSQIISLWQHRDFAARMEARDRLSNDPRWRDIVERVSPLIERIETKLLVPSPLWTPRA